MRLDFLKHMIFPFYCTGTRLELPSLEVHMQRSESKILHWKCCECIMLGVSAALQKHSLGADSRKSKTHSFESLHN